MANHLRAETRILAIHQMQNENLKLDEQLNSMSGSVLKWPLMDSL